MSLEGTSWTVTQLDGESVIDGSEPTIAFDNGRAAGTTGCNRWFSAYEVDGDAISFGMAGSTMMMCHGDGVMEQEQAFLRTLELIESFEVADGQLALKGSEGAGLMRGVLPHEGGGGVQTE